MSKRRVSLSDGTLRCAIPQKGFVALLQEGNLSDIHE